MFNNKVNSTVPVYEIQLDENGYRRLVKTTKTRNVQDAVDLYRDDCDIVNQIERAVLSGTTDRLSCLGQGGDVLDSSFIPKDLIDVQESVNKTVSQYNALPDNVKACFNGYDDFKSCVQNGTLGQRLAAADVAAQAQKDAPAAPTTQVKQEVKPDPTPSGDVKSKTEVMSDVK